MRTTARWMAMAIAVALAVVAIPGGFAQTEGRYVDNTGTFVSAVAHTKSWTWVDSYTERAHGGHSAAGYAKGELLIQDSDGEGSYVGDYCWIPTNGLISCETSATASWCAWAQARTGNPDLDSWVTDDKVYNRFC